MASLYRSQAEYRPLFGHSEGSKADWEGVRGCPMLSTPSTLVRMTALQHAFELVQVVLSL